MSPYILLILLLPVLQGCLVVRTPGCECPVLALRFSNIDQNIGSHAFYQNVSGYPTVTPVVRTEECAVSMYCEGDYSLVVFDKETATMLGAYSADGVCDPRTQKWQVDTGSGEGLISFDRLFGICVNYAPTCACPMHIISSDAYAEQLLSPHVDWTDRLKLYHYAVLPIFNSETECPTNFECPERHAPIAVTSNRRFPHGASRLTCDSNKKTWTVQDDSSKIEDDPFLAVGCYRLAKCECPILALSSSNIAQHVADHAFYNNVSGYPIATPVVKSEDCSVSMYCEGDYSLVVFDKETATMLGAYSADGICDPRTQKWQVDTGSGAGFTSFDRLFGICVNYAPCDCSFRKISDNAIAKEILTNNYRWDRYKVLYFSEPIWNTETGMCSSDFHCKESGHGKITIAGDTYVMEDNVQLECTSEKKWTIRVSGEEYPRRINAELLDIGCYKRETCNPTFPCLYKPIDKLSELINHPLYEDLTPFITKIEAPEVTIDGCYVKMTCNSPYSMAILDDENIYPSPDRTVRVQCLPGPIWHFWQTLPTHPFYGACVELK